MADQTYDKLFYRIFSRRDEAIDLVRNLVPPSVLRRIDLGSIQVDKKSYVDEKLRRHYSDLLIRFEAMETTPPLGERAPSIRKELYVYVLVDHKSSPDKWVPFQLLRYVGNIYQGILEKKKKAEVMGKELPEVVPVVFYHGVERWSSSLQTADLISYTEERDYIPHFEPFFYDMNRIEEIDLRGAVQTVVALVVFKYIRRRFTEDVVGVLLKQLRRLPSGSEMLKTLERGIAEAKTEEEIEQFLAVARKMRYNEIEGDVMTFAEAKLQEGIKEGKLKDKQELVKRFLSRKYNLTEEEAARIDRIEDLEALDGALDKIIEAGEKRQVLEKLGL